MRRTGTPPRPSASLAMRVLLPLLVAAYMAPGLAHAQMDSREGIALQNQILELRRDLQALQTGRGAPPPPQDNRGGGELTAQLLDRVASLEEQVRRLRGQLDEQGNLLRRQNDDLAKQIADLNFQLQNAPPPARSAPPPREVPPPSLAPSSLGQASPPDAPAAPGRRPPELAMQEGNAALARRDYAAAGAAAREVLAGGRASPRAGDAQFLLAQSLAGKRDYQAAAVAYDDAYTRSRTGSRAPDALVGLANALLGINERQAACATLDKLRAEFPSPRPDVREAAVSIRGRAGCR